MDDRFESRPALASVAGARLRPLPEGGVALVLGRMGGPGPDVAGARAIAPGQWLVIEGDVEALAARLEGFAVIDQGHGRVGIAVEGPGAMDLLATGTGVDLAVMPVGETAATLFGPIAVVLTRVGVEAFELYVGRSFAESLWEDLVG